MPHVNCERSILKSYRQGQSFCHRQANRQDKNVDCGNLWGIKIEIYTSVILYDEL